jgi:hypothetical protein
LFLQSIHLELRLKPSLNDVTPIHVYPFKRGLRIYLNGSHKDWTFSNSHQLPLELYSNMYTLSQVPIQGNLKHFSIY